MFQCNHCNESFIEKYLENSYQSSSYWSKNLMWSMWIKFTNSSLNSTLWESRGAVARARADIAKAFRKGPSVEFKELLIRGRYRKENQNVEFKELTPSTNFTNSSFGSSGSFGSLFSTGPTLKHFKIKVFLMI